MREEVGGAGPTGISSLTEAYVLVIRTVEALKIA